MFKKILIANRGEIAARIIRTCKQMGISTIAVHSEADKEAVFVREADEAYLLGGPRVSESYNNIDKILEIAKDAGAEAIHPGYGFLSENALFAERCSRENIVFIGPDAQVIAKMGEKIEARKMMEAAGLPVVPGVSRPLADAEEASLHASRIGYPVMLKASAGGGGIGMGAVASEEELLKTFGGHQKRAKSFFGNGDMFLEKLIENPRHIEVQILADSFGGTVALWERECSIQRRNQKVVEEAPSPFVTPKLREELCEAAVKAAKALGYINAGTFEFIMDEDRNYYFLEMNTRLQVEHPVTEEITGIDIVEQQIRIAHGERLPFSQEDIKLEGHAIEARVYAEDPATFHPSPGKITVLTLPEGRNVRNEIGVHEGDAITPYYDGMFAKLVVRGDTREDCIKNFLEAVKAYRVEGIKTNLPLVERVISHAEFQKGATTTSFINRHLTKSEGSKR